MNNENNWKSRKVTKLVDDVLAGKIIKKLFSKDGVWKGEWSDFDTNMADDFWGIVNGHDILSALRYANQDATKRYSNIDGCCLNRDFEMDLIDKYDYSSLVDTEMYQEMRKAEIVNQVEMG